jgi:SsrA-binding protein
MSDLASNQRAFFDYEIQDKFEAGLVLSGQEVKSIKNGHVSLKGSYVTLKGDEAYLINAYVSPYPMAGPLLHYEPTRSRKLLLHRQELRQLIGKTKQKGSTLVPLKIYVKHGKIKLEFGIGVGKKKFDKRESIKKREVERQIERALKTRK